MKYLFQCFHLPLLYFIIFMPVALAIKNAATRLFDAFSFLLRLSVIFIYVHNRISDAY